MLTTQQSFFILGRLFLIATGILSSGIYLVLHFILAVNTLSMQQSSLASKLVKLINLFFIFTLCFYYSIMVNLLICNLYKFALFELKLSKILVRTSSILFNFQSEFSSNAILFSEGLNIILTLI